MIGELERLVAEHRYREPVWAQLMTAYYLTARQADALDAYQRLKTTLADDLGIDPSVTLSDLHGRILRQEPLDVKQAVRSTAAETMVSMAHRSATGRSVAAAQLRATSGQCFALTGAATRIGRL